MPRQFVQTAPRQHALQCRNAVRTPLLSRGTSPARLQQRQRAPLPGAAAIEERCVPQISRDCCNTSTSHTYSALLLLAPSLLLQAASAGSAAAATVCIDVPDWLVDFDPLGFLLHTPVVTLGLALLALSLLPRIIRGAIRYLALPTAVVLLAWLGVTYPQQTAVTIENVLEFAKDHPGASTAGIALAAGVLLGPDLLTAGAVAGILLLLAAQSGFVQLPRLPELPSVPGPAARLIQGQLSRAQQQLGDRLAELDK